MRSMMDRFIKYAKIHTTSDEDSTTFPSTEIQKNLGKIIVDDLKSIGVEDVSMDDKGYVYASVPANTEKLCNTIGFIDHMDISPAASRENVNPQIHENYNGEDIILNEEQGVLYYLLKNFRFYR